MTAFVIPVAIVGTAILSGVFGMGGGSILMGVYAAFFPVASAMVLHGVTQFSSNFSRFWFLREHAAFRILGPFLAGGILIGTLCAALAFHVSKQELYLILGSLPLIILLPQFLRIQLPEVDITHRRVAFLSGILVVGAQILAGTSGPLLDIFFIRGPLDRFSVIATKALLQSLGHVAKIVYWASIALNEITFIPHSETTLSDNAALSENAALSGNAALSPWLFVIAILLPPIGSRIGKMILSHIDEAPFRRYSIVLIVIISVLLLARGITL